MGQLGLCAAATQPTHPRACKPQLLSSCSASPEVHVPSSPCSTIRGATATREAHTLQLESSPCSPQLEKAHTQQWRACAPDRGLKNRKDSHTKGSPLMGGEISWDRKGASESQRRAQEPAWVGRAERDLNRWAVPLSWTLQLETHVHGTDKGWVLNLVFRGQTQGEDFYWLHRDSLKGLECGKAVTRGVWGRSLGLL